MQMLDLHPQKYDLSILMTTAHDFPMLPRYCGPRRAALRRPHPEKGFPVEVLESDGFAQAFHMGARYELLVYALRRARRRVRSMTFMKNALLAVLVMAPLFACCHNDRDREDELLLRCARPFRFTRASPSACSAARPSRSGGRLLGLAVAFALLFSFVRSRSSQSADTVIGVFSSDGRARHFIATMGGGSFTQFNKYLIGDILSVTPAEISALALVLLAVAVCGADLNQLILTAIHPQLASSRGLKTARNETFFTVVIAVVWSRWR